LGVIRAVVTAGEPGEILFLFVWQVTRFHQCPFGQISQNLDTKKSISVMMNTFGTVFRKFYCRGRFSKKNAKISQIFNILQLQVAATPQ